MGVYGTQTTLTTPTLDDRVVLSDAGITKSSTLQQVLDVLVPAIPPADLDIAAADVSVEDVAENFTGTDVEAVLEEIWDAISGVAVYTDENARDAIGAALVAGTGIDITVVDGSDTITVALDADAATQAELDAHTGDTSDAHDASAISVADGGGLLTATDVEAALAEIVGLAKAREYGIALTDDETAIVHSGIIGRFRVPVGFTLTSIRAELSSACASGTFTIDVQESGSTILSTKVTIDATETTSQDGTPSVISDANIADNAVLTFLVDDDGDGTATGLKIWLIGSKA